LYRPGAFRLGRLGAARLDAVWFGLLWYGRLGAARFGLVWYGSIGYGRPGSDGQVEVRSGKARLGTAWQAGNGVER
jgi:hypothetical protein